MPSRIHECFAELRARRPALIAYITAGDPDAAQTLTMLHGLVEHGVDIIELGIPFSDPMADGPVIQAASTRALQNGASLQQTLQIAQSFRERNQTTPLVLMGYYNPIFRYGPERFTCDALASGVDGVLVVDLPYEFDDECARFAQKQGLDVIRLLSPTTTASRCAAITERASGFLYYVAITGITGAELNDAQEVNAAVKALKETTSLPIAVGFGIKAPAQAATIEADAIVMGSAVIELWHRHGMNQALTFLQQTHDAIAGTGKRPR